MSMRPITTIFLCAVLCFCIAPRANAQSSAPLPVEAFGSLPAIADAAISPDGSKVALATAISGTPAVSVIDLAASRPVYSGRIADESELRSVGWASDNYVIYRITRTLHPGAVLPYNMRFRGSPRRV